MLKALTTAALLAAATTSSAQRITALDMVSESSDLEFVSTYIGQPIPCLDHVWADLQGDDVPELVCTGSVLAKERAGLAVRWEDGTWELVTTLAVMRPIVRDAADGSQWVSVRTALYAEPFSVRIAPQ